VFREHYKQLGSLVCAEFDADNFDRVTAGAGLGRVTEYQAECKYDELSPRRWNGCSRGPADIQSWRRAADLKSELIKAGGSALSNCPEASELGMELETLPTAWSQGDR
jgi:hypothetical protein